MDNVLVLVRHGQSEWNKLNLFTGWRDPDLTETGVEEARRAGKLIKKERIVFDIAFTSGLKRAQHTLEMILGELGQQDLETIKDRAINERHYGWSTYGAAPMMSRLPEGRASRIPLRASFPIMRARSCLRFWLERMCLSRRTATRSGRSSCSSTNCRLKRS